ncbi:predicted protein [Streptomyces viridosporus ATCC 14672]|uniref:Predicted protein n=1 Tax=Streptomyces viridosporus (strain ATCC 14672 / DSM 40746 / JCM 4963 / KCTC 9882 / NRRL B-12104 / FH 1290) TaxID=566461 RepID=D6A580_STRV1|nr:predicted protein [Streptomyces viridosporus ATCC 14672]
MTRAAPIRSGPGDLGPGGRQKVEIDRYRESERAGDAPRPRARHRLTGPPTRHRPAGDASATGQ